jgi:apolipoprotein N-acyltransferase
MQPVEAPGVSDEKAVRAPGEPAVQSAPSGDKPASERAIFSRAMLPSAAAAAFSGLVLKLVSPPHGLDFLHWMSFAPLLVVVAAVGENRRRAFKLGYLCGFSAVFVLFFWLAQTIDLFSNIPLPLAACIIALFAAVWGLPYGVLALAVHPLRRRFGQWWVLLFPCVWVLGELVQPALFPYYQGVGQYRNPYTWQLASVFGAMGVSWLILATNTALAALILARRSGEAFPARPVAVVAILFVANLGYGYGRFQHVERALASAPVARVAMLQQGVSMVQRIQDRGPEVLKSWLELTARVVDQHPDLVVWPEGSIYYNPTDKRVQPVFEEMTKKSGFFFLVGGGTREADPDDPTKRASWNSAYLFDASGKIAGRYDKMVPMPFGEYLPWPVSYLKPYIEGVGSFRAGSKPTVFQSGTFSFTTPICYEAILESQMRALANADAYVNITNDGWFGDTAAPHQHAMLSAALAVEMGRPMLRIAYTGISMVVEPHGVIRYETAPYTEVAQVVEMRVQSFETPYRTWGRAFPWVASAIGAVALVLTRRGVTPTAPSA